MLRIFNRAVDKGCQIVSFYRHTRTPMALTLDSLRLKRRPYAAVAVNGLKLSLLPRSGESFTFYENIIRRDYLKFGITLRPGSTVVDIGANIGAFTVLAGLIVGPTGRVIAFEPVTETFQRLEGNVALNGLRNIECHRAAIYSRDGAITLQIYAKSAFATAHKVNEVDHDRPVETVPCLTLQRVFRDFRIDHIDLLKVDCEGSEYGIFETLSPDLAARIDQIAVEVHPVEGKSPGQLCEKISTLGFTTAPAQGSVHWFRAAVRSEGA
jgi:FkbM family methyltransferase